MELDSNVSNSGGLDSSKYQQEVGWGECGVSVCVCVCVCVLVPQ